MKSLQTFHWKYELNGSTVEDEIDLAQLHLLVRIPTRGHAMSYLFPGTTAVENSRRLSQSALPNAPVVPDDPEPRRGLGSLLRALVARRRRGYESSTPSRRTTSRRAPSTTTRTSPEV
jgi:hypothetical protein